MKSPIKLKHFLIIEGLLVQVPIWVDSRAAAIIAFILSFLLQGFILGYMLWTSQREVAAAQAELRRLKAERDRLSASGKSTALWVGSYDNKN